MFVVCASNSCAIVESWLLWVFWVGSVSACLPLMRFWGAGLGVCFSGVAVGDAWTGAAALLALLFAAAGGALAFAVGFAFAFPIALAFCTSSSEASAPD